MYAAHLGDRAEAAPGTWRFSAWAGPQIACRRVVEIITDYSEVSVVGITEVLKALAVLVPRHAPPLVD